LRTPNVSVLQLDPDRPDDFENAGGPFDTVLCVNVLEYAADPGMVIECAGRVLKPGGSMVVLTPQSPALYGSLDRTLGHRRRFSRTELQALLDKHGFAIKRIYQLNKIGTPGWWLYGKVLRRKHIGKLMLKIFDKTVWFWRWVEGLMPWPGLSLVVVANKE
jgi:SAM-dependent methyltransferase